MTHDPPAPLTARWYCVNADGLASLCLDEADAREMAAQCDQDYPPRNAPHRAVLMGDVAAAEREIERLHGVVRQVNDRCDHLGMSLRDVKAERDSLRQRLEEIESAVRESEELARHVGPGRGREWAACGTWLYHGDRVVVLRAQTTG